MVDHHAALLGVDICLTWDNGQLQVCLRGAYGTPRAVRQQARLWVYGLIEPAIHQMTRSILPLKLHTGIDAKAPIRLMNKIQYLAVVERLVHHLAPLKHGKDVILIHVEELI